jgi:hypothetical protein
MANKWAVVGVKVKIKAATLAAIARLLAARAVGTMVAKENAVFA